jgi:mannosyltransferase OCH1-like enzyme
MIGHLHRRRNGNDLEGSTIHTEGDGSIIPNRTENSIRRKDSMRSLLLLVPRTILFVLLSFFLFYSMVDLTQHRHQTGVQRIESLSSFNPPSVRLLNSQENPLGRLQEKNGKLTLVEETDRVSTEQQTRQENIKGEEINQQHRHLIPNNILFTHYINLLSTDSADLEDSEDKALQRNVRQTIALHPTSQVNFYTDQDCIQAIQTAMGGDKPTPLVSYFQKEPKGMCKADICRGAALYNLGGLYFDIDIQPRMNIFSVLQPLSTEFTTVTVHKDSNWKGSFFQAFIGVTPKHPIMKRYLELFIQHYNGTRRIKKGPLGVLLLRQAYDDLNRQQQMKNNTVLWEEVRYDPVRFPNVPPTIGSRRACHFLVAIPGTSIAPFYSRVRGSRMCGGKES